MRRSGEPPRGGPRLTSCGAAAAASRVEHPGELVERLDERLVVAQIEEPVEGASAGREQGAGASCERRVFQNGVFELRRSNHSVDRTHAKRILRVERDAAE